MSRILRMLPLVAALVLGLLAASAPETRVRVREANLADDGKSQLVVEVSAEDVGVLDAAAFTVTDGGRVIDDLHVQSLQETEVEPGAAVLVMDVSGSTNGGPLEAARRAADALAREVLELGVDVGVVSFNGAVTVHTAPTSVTTEVSAGLERLEASGGTALYDGIVAASELLVGHEGVRDVLVFSDGRDKDSTAGAADAVRAAESAGAAVTTIALETEQLDMAALEELAAATGGNVLSAGSTADLAAGFEQVANDLGSRYVLTYTSPPSDEAETDIAVEMLANGRRVTDEITVVDTRLAASTPPAVAADGPAIAVLGTSVGLYIGVGAAALAVLVLVASVALGDGESAGGRLLRRNLEVTTSGRKPEADESGSILAQAAALVERLPSDDAKTDDLQKRLERAGWPLRASEYRVLQLGGVVGGAALAFALFGNLLVAVAVAVLGGVAPGLALSMKTSRRARRFEQQLPEVLQLLAGSLRAGYGLLQAVDTVAKEADDPAASELARVLSEARLGGSVEHALEAMADRIGSEDFRWVVIAINIQRQVGGNLADLLETVATTIREREELRREVKTLSAEGRLSAVILVALPFLIAIYTALVNPKYLSVLTGSAVGRAAIAGAAVLMGLGIVWIRKIIRIKV